MLSDVPEKGVWIAQYTASSLRLVVVPTRKTGSANLLLASVAQRKVSAVKIDIGSERVSGGIVSLFDG